MKENKSKRRTYTLEFKKSAVALITEQGYKPAEAARSLGIGNNMIHKWRKDLESNGLAKLSNDEHEELKRLRKEVKKLKMEKEILKKASAYFAKEIL